MSHIIYNGRRALCSQVVELLKGVKLLPGEELQIIKSRSESSSIEEWIERVRKNEKKISENPFRDIFIYYPPKELKDLDKLLASPIEKLELYHKSRYTALHNAGIHFIGQLARMWPEKELGMVKGIGRKTAASRRIKHALAAHGLKFDMTFPIGPREIKSFKKVPADFILKFSFYRFRAYMKCPRRIGHQMSEELKKEGIISFYDLIHTTSDVIKQCVYNVYVPIFMKHPDYPTVEYARRATDEYRLSRFYLYLHKYKIQLRNLSDERE